MAPLKASEILKKGEGGVYLNVQYLSSYISVNVKVF